MRKIDWPIASVIVLYHLLALLAFVPWFFSWTGVIVAIVAARLSGLLGINICYHRLASRTAASNALNGSSTSLR